MNAPAPARQVVHANAEVTPRPRFGSAPRAEFDDSICPSVPLAALPDQV